MLNRSTVRFALAAFLLGMICIHAVLFWVVRQHVVTGSSDFRIFYTAGLMVRRGEGRVLYNEELQEKFQREFALPAVNRGGPLPYNHPPFEALLYVPFTYLPYFSAYCLWFVVNLLVIGGSIYLVRGRLRTLTRDFRSFVIFAPLAFFPIVYALLQGQDSILLLGSYFLVYSALLRKKDVQAGACLGLGLFKFHLVLPFACMLLLRRRWRVLAGFLVVAVVEGLVSLVMVGGRELLFYPRFAWQINRQQAPGVIVPANMGNLRGLFTGWRGMNPAPYSVEIALVIASIILMVWASRQWRPELVDAQNWDGGFSVCLIVTYLVGYHGYNQDMSFLLLPLLLAMDRMLAAWEKTGAGMKCLLGLMFFSPLYLLLTLQLSHQNLFSIVLLCLAGYLARAATARPQALANRNRQLLSVLPL